MQEQSVFLQTTYWVIRTFVDTFKLTLANKCLNDHTLAYLAE